LLALRDCTALTYLRRQLCAVCRLPLLQDGSVVIRESCAIMLYLLETYGGQA